MISFEQALAALAALPASPGSEEVPLAQALGRVLAAEVALAGDLPPFDRSAMDGFAIHPQPDRQAYAIAGTIAAGAALPAALPPGGCLRVMTGAPVPAGATVVPWERVVERDGQVTVADPADLVPGRNTARRGEDGRAGDPVIAAGTVLSPLLLASAAMAGCRTLRLASQPRVAVVVTGDEVGTAIADTNGPLLAGLLAAWSCQAVCARAGDRAEELRAVLAAQDAPLLVTTGGVGGSERDLVKPVAAALGFAEVFHEVAMQPGKPVLCMRHPGGRVLIGLPGNPVSVLATAHLLLQPLLVRLGAAPGPGWTSLPAAHTHQAKGRRLLFQPARRAPDGRLALVAWNGSGDLIAAAAADGLAEIAPGACWQAGDPLRFLPYTGGGGGLLPARSRP